MPASIRSVSGAFHVVPARGPRRRRGLARLIARFVVLAALATVVAATIIVVVKSPFSSAWWSGCAGALHVTPPHLPPYWTVHPGETLTTISAKTGLTIANLRRSTRISIRARFSPARPEPLQASSQPRHKPLGPRVWTVRSGDPFGLIAAKTRINIVKLEQLNPQLKPATLQPEIVSSRAPNRRGHTDRRRTTDEVSSSLRDTRTMRPTCQEHIQPGACCPELRDSLLRLGASWTARFWATHKSAAGQTRHRPAGTSGVSGRPGASRRRAPLGTGLASLPASGSSKPVEVRWREAVRSIQHGVDRPRVRSPRPWSRRLTCPSVRASSSSSPAGLT